MNAADSLVADQYIDWFCTQKVKTSWTCSHCYISANIRHVNTAKHIRRENCKKYAPPQNCDKHLTKSMSSWMVQTNFVDLNRRASSLVTLTSVALWTQAIAVIAKSKRKRASSALPKFLSPRWCAIASSRSKRTMTRNQRRISRRLHHSPCTWHWIAWHLPSPITLALQVFAGLISWLLPPPPKTTCATPLGLGDGTGVSNTWYAF